MRASCLEQRRHSAAGIGHECTSQSARQAPLLFALGLDGQIYEQTFDAAGTPAGGYVPTQPAG